MAKGITRDTELSQRAAIREKLTDIFHAVEKGFQDQQDRSDQIMDFWDAYNCKLGSKQFYNGNSQIFVPIVRNAVEARKTRFVNQLFPVSNRHVEVVTSEPDYPHALVALVEHYIKSVRLRTEVLPALLVAGDIEGQYTVYLDWSKVARHAVSKTVRPVEVDGIEAPELGEVETIVEEEIEDAGPDVEVIADSDFLVLPATVNSLDRALERGGSVTVVRRWSKAQVRRMMEHGDFVADVAEDLLEAMSKEDPNIKNNTAKELASAAGIKSGGGGKYVQGYETWAKLKVGGEMRICRAYFAGGDRILGCKLNPYWCDRLPILSAPVKKSPGVFKGVSMIGPGVLDMQIAANDAVNEGMDSAAYALMPIILTDPEKNPRVGSMILDLAAVWEVDPNSTRFAQFPELWKNAFEIVASCKNEIFQALSVNPAMMPQQTGRGNKRNQAEIANEQQVDLLTTTDAVTVVENEVLTPLVQRIVEYDHQFREDDLLVRAFGEMGLKATMETISPVQMNRRITLQWFGVEAARNAAQIQQMIAALNVIRGIPPNLYPGYTLNVAPLLVHVAMTTFGPRLAPQIFQPLSEQLAADPETENDMLAQGFEVMVHALDNDGQHIQVHLKAPRGPQRDVHIQRHQIQMQQKQAAAQGPKGQQGVPGGAGPGVAGTPVPGAQPALPRQNKGPAGAIRPDSMPAAGAVPMPRKM